MENTKKQIGEIFKTKRQEMNLSLKEVENATSIKMIYLQAIEDGTVNKFLSQVYVLGFVKQYATFLGLDGEKIVKQNSGLYKNVNDKKEFDYGIGTLEVRNTHNSSAKFLPNGLWIVIAVVVLIGAWFFARALGVI